MKFYNKLAVNLFLRPTSFIWESIYRIRRSSYEYGFIKKNYFKVPIISVGNITFGGTGKTPLIIWLIEKLENRKKEVAVLTRGYKGKLENDSGVIKGGQRFRSNPVEYGDEPLLISRKMNSGAVIVGKRRSENLKKYFFDISPDIVLLDDGFQHLKLSRAYNIVLFDALLPIDRYKTAPMGYLREGLTALKDADAILISRADQVEEQKIESLLNFLSPYHRKEVLVSKLKYTATGLFNTFDKVVCELDELKDKRIFVVSAIASPESFYKVLESHGAIIVDTAIYPDHYYFTTEDINELLIKTVQLGAIIVSSEKDMVKIRRVSQDPRISYLGIMVSFISGEEELLSDVDKILKLDS